jgi:hypothetical protein
MLTEQLNLDALIENDARCHALTRGLLQLATSELERLEVALAESPDAVVVDSYNFDPATGAWCPLAVGLDVPATAQARGGILSDAQGKELIVEVGSRKHGRFSLNPMSGISGTFFRDDRHAELHRLVEYLLARGRDNRLLPSWRLAG